MSSLEPILKAIARLPRDWHGAGSVPIEVLRAIVRHTEGREILHSLETGSGKTTLLFSNISQDHKVFAVDVGAGSISQVRASPIFKSETVQYIEGPTQLTLPQHNFEHTLQIAMLDGPHGYPFPEIEYWCVYPHLEEDSLLIVDDIQIPTVYNFFCFLKDDEMFELTDVVSTTAFFRRTDAPVFDAYGDGWWLQNYNKVRHPIAIVPRRELNNASLWQKVKYLVPIPVKLRLKRMLGKT